MSLWTRTTPPAFAPHAVAGENGWVHPITNETLEAFATKPAAAVAAVQEVNLVKGFVADSGDAILDKRTAFATGDYMVFAARFNSQVLVTGAPYVALVINGTTVHAAYAHGSGTPTLLFIYRIESTNSAVAGQVSVTSPVELNSGTIKDSAAVAATLTFSAPSLASIAVN